MHEMLATDSPADDRAFMRLAMSKGMGMSMTVRGTYFLSTGLI
jgi:L-aminopeptidase/D-esterase-like protein